MTDPTGPSSGTTRMLRGGSWLVYISSMQCANRVYYVPTTAAVSFGFRVTRTVDTSHTDGNPDWNHPGLVLWSIQPNPFTTSTRITYTVPNEASGKPALLSVYDITGRLVRLINGTVQPAGQYSVRWNGDDDSGRGAAAGMYFLRLEVGATISTRPMLIVR